MYIVTLPNGDPTEGFARLDNAFFYGSLNIAPKHGSFGIELRDDDDLIVQMWSIKEQHFGVTNTEFHEDGTSTTTHQSADEVFVQLATINGVPPELQRLYDIPMPAGPMEG